MSCRGRYIRISRKGAIGFYLKFLVVKSLLWFIAIVFPYPDPLSPAVSYSQNNQTGRAMSVLPVAGKWNHSLIFPWTGERTPHTTLRAVVLNLCRNVVFFVLFCFGFCFLFKDLKTNKSVSVFPIESCWTALAQSRTAQSGKIRGCLVSLKTQGN